MEKFDLNCQLKRAEKAVSKFGSQQRFSEQRRVVLAEEDMFLERMMNEVAKKQRERSIGVVVGNEVSSNLRRIADTLSCEPKGIAFSSFYDCENDAAVQYDALGGRAQSRRPIPSGIWASKEVVSQKEYDVDASNNQEADPDSAVSDATDQVESHFSAPLVEQTIDEGSTTCVEVPISTHFINSTSHEVASVFNRLKTNDHLFFAPEVDDFNSTQYETKFFIDLKPLSVANGRLLRRIFDGDSAAPITYTNQSWSIQQKLFEAVLSGRFSFEHFVCVQRENIHLANEIRREKELRLRSEKDLLYERSKTQSLTARVRENLKKKRDYQTSVLTTAIRVDCAASTFTSNEIPELSKVLGRRNESNEKDHERLYEDLQLVFSRMSELRECELSGGYNEYPFLSVASIRDKLASVFSVSDSHLNNINSWGERANVKAKRRLIELRFQSMESAVMELEDSLSGCNQLFRVGDNVFAKMGSIARILTVEQRKEVFGNDLPLVQFYELTRARETVCPLCRFEFDATKPLSFYADQIQEKTRRVTEEIHVLVGRRNAHHERAPDDALETTIGSQQSANSVKTKKVSEKNRKAASFSRGSDSSRPSSSLTRSEPSSPKDTLQEFESQVMMMALQQMNNDLETKVKVMQEKLDEATATVRLEKMHYSTLEAKYKETLRDTSDYRKKFDAELKRSTELTEHFRAEVEGLRDELNKRQCRIDDLEDEKMELSEKMERITAAEKHINTVRFGFPVGEQKADLSFQEIGYVYYRKYFEVSTQLKALRQKYHLDADEVILKDGAAGPSQPFKKVSLADVSTLCKIEVIKSTRSIEAQVEPIPSNENDSQTDVCQFESSDIIVAEMCTVGCQTSSSVAPRVVAVLPDENSDDIEMLRQQLNQCFTNADELCDQLRKIGTKPKVGLLDALNVVANAKPSENTDLKECFADQALLVAKDDEIAQLRKEKCNALNAYNTVVARMHDLVAILENRKYQSSRNISVPSPSVEYDENSAQSLSELTEESGALADVDKLIMEELSHRKQIMNSATSIVVPLHVLQELIAFLQGELCGAAKRRRMQCTVVDLTVNSTMNKCRMPRHSYSSPRHSHHVLPPLTVLPSGSERLLPDNRKTLVSKLIVLEASQDARSTAHRALSPRSSVSQGVADVPPLPFCLSPIPTEAVRAYAKVERSIENTSSALIIQSFSRTNNDDTVLVKAGAEESSSAPQLQNDTCTLQNTDDSVQPPASHPFCSPPKSSLTEARTQATHLAARIQSQQFRRLPTPTSKMPIDMDFSQPVEPLLVGDELDTRHELQMASFLSRPLPPFRGAIPSTVITGHSSDAYRKPPGGVASGWNDQTLSAQRLKVLTNQTAMRITRTVRTDSPHLGLQKL